MKISYNWLKEYLDFDIEPEELSKILTDTGLEVEGLETFESIKGGLEGVVIGKVLTCEKHPDADKLSVTSVDIGDEEPVQIVCGAPNVAAGQTVAVATVGATLYPEGAEDGFKIKKAKIRGEASFGMICAEDELGLGQSHDGIMVLNEAAKAGTKAASYFEIEHDTVFEIGLTPNRIDGASHIGTVRDIAAFLKQQGTPVEIKKPSIEAYAKDDEALDIKVEVVNPEACPRYSGVTLTNIKVEASPEWLQNKLKAIGQTPINNIVDITNFVLHETSQPLHAFDAGKISGNKISVKLLAEGTELTTLDEKERKLSGKDLIICDGNDKGMCIAGVFGGADSGVSDATTSIFLESACFDPVFIRKSARYHVLNTDASFRFERGTDPNATIYALKRAALLMKELAGAKISSEIFDFYPEPVEDFPVELSYQNIDRLIGKKLEKETIKSILESLDISIASETEEGLSVRVAPYRVDVKREVDVIEEILRIYGYNNIEFPQHVNSTLSYAEKPDPEKVVNAISDMLTSQGFFEIKSNSLTKESYFEEDDKEVVSLHNALSNDLSKLRKSLLQGGLEAIAYNINRKRSDLKLYEFGNCYFHNPETETDNPQKRYFEESHLGIFVSGNWAHQNWTTLEQKSSFYHMKSVVDILLGKLGIDKKKVKISSVNNTFFSDALSYDIEKGNVVTFGLIDKKTLTQFDIKQDVIAAEFNWDLMLKLHKKSKVNFKPLSKQLEIKRDLSLLLNKEVKFEQLEDLAFKADKRLLKKVELFDIYEGDKIEAGKKSYALSFILHDEEKTLKDKQIEKTMKNIAMAFESELGALVRGA